MASWLDRKIECRTRPPDPGPGPIAAQTLRVLLRCCPLLLVLLLVLGSRLFLPLVPAGRCAAPTEYPSSAPLFEAAGSVRRRDRPSTGAP
jgi:hypothetical protein